MMIDAEMYGMIPSAKTVKRDSAPPENMLNKFRMPPCCPSKSACSCCGLMPGTGMCAPMRYTNNANNRKVSRRYKSPNLPDLAS